MRDGLGGIQSVALVGGTSDIGLAIAHEMTALGAKRFVLAGRDVEAMRELGGDLPSAEFVALDVAELTAHETGVDSLFSGGDLDVVILAAGVLHTQPSADQISNMALVNGAGAISLLAEIGQRLRSQGHGQLVVISSMAVVRPRPSNYWYGASKVGVDFAARGLADELGNGGVKVTLVRPGFVHSKMTEGMRPAPFSCKPENVAVAVAESVQHDRGGILWVPRNLKLVSYLVRWVPRGMLHRLDR